MSVKFQKIATRLLTKFDESDGRIELVQKPQPVWDPVLGEMVPGVETITKLVGVTVAFSQGLIDGTTIQNGDVMAIVTSAVKPKQEDKLLIDGVHWSIVGQPIVNYTGVDIAYKIHARK